ncbi:MAG: enoyl-CoA hydratase/isomerase family protein [Chlamydiales bacterium]|nr:enoyl-CoA hydratase/isomerase family protein [Chlamydiales bacterium]
MSVVTVSKPEKGIVVVELNRPEARNALSIELLEALKNYIKFFGQEEGNRVLIMRGAGNVFCAGLDLKEAIDPRKAHIMAEKVAEALKELYYSPLITIAAIQGAAIAGGAGIFAACDLVVAAEGTKIGYPETRRGLVAALVMTLLRRQVPDRFVRELLFTGELFSAEKSKEIGLINEVVSADKLTNTVMTMARNVLKGAPNATTLSKSLLDELQTTTMEQDIKRALAFHLHARSTSEADEGILAFTEKREPNWD